MTKFKTFAKCIPLVMKIHQKLHRFYAKRKLEGKNVESVFTEIYTTNEWKGNESVSGTGSDLKQTKTVVKLLPTFFQDSNIRTVLDIPCGDFHWMKQVNLSGIDYTGADIVSEIVSRNNDNFKKKNISFQQLNLLSDELPATDLIFCRDCLVHFSFSDIFTALNNIRRSGSKFLLTTTFTDLSRNQDILTGQWRPINLQIAPFFFPKPIKVLIENCTEGEGQYHDKSLALWKIDEIANFK